MMKRSLKIYPASLLKRCRTPFNGSVNSPRKDWKRLKAWYGRIEPLAVNYTKLDKPFKEMRDIIGELFALLADYARHSRDDQLFERFASGCLPYTFTEYSQYLYENGGTRNGWRFTASSVFPSGKSKRTS